MEPKGTFGPRLRQERERRQISLASIAANTKISASLLEALERDDVKRWPSGIFRRAFIRSYATAIGLDADEIIKEFAERFPDPSAPPAENAAGPDAIGRSPGEAPRANPVLTVQPHRAATGLTAQAQRVESDGTLPNRIEFVFRVSVPRSWVNRALRMKSLASRVPALRRQNQNM